MNLSPNKNQGLREKDSFFMRLFKLPFTKGKTSVVSANETEEAKQLVESIYNARKEWISANTNFEHADSEEIIDYYTYKIKAYEVMYEYLIKKAKEQGVTVDLLETIELPYNKNSVIN